MNDLMRLPLGILSSIGFIGAGAILRRDNFVIGVTTAATIWFLTVVGLCFGGGQVALGSVGTVIAVVVLTLVKSVEDKMQRDRQGRLVIAGDSSAPPENEIREVIQNEGFRVSSCGYSFDEGSGQREWTCDLQWRAKVGETEIPKFIKRLSASTGVVRVSWTPQSR